MKGARKSAGEVCLPVQPAMASCVKQRGTVNSERTLCPVVATHQQDAVSLSSDTLIIQLRYSQHRIRYSHHYIRYSQHITQESEVGCRNWPSLNVPLIISASKMYSGAESSTAVPPVLSGAPSAGPVVVTHQQDMVSLTSDTVSI